MGDFTVEFKEQIPDTTLASLAGSVPLSITGEEGRTYNFEADFGTDKASLKSLRQAIEQVTGKDTVATLEAQEE